MHEAESSMPQPISGAETNVFDAFVAESYSLRRRTDEGTGGGQDALHASDACASRPRHAHDMYYILVEGNAFLWHQIRCFAAVLFLVVSRSRSCFERLTGD